jgi:hypothetical protein
VADEGIGKIGAMLEHLGSRFDLVIEAVTGFGGRLEALREDIFAQFAEVGRQIRFVSEQIAANRAAVAALRSDLGAEMVRLGETLGATRVEFRGQLSSEAEQVRRQIETYAVETLAKVREELGRVVEADGAGKALHGEVSAAAESVIRKLGAELKSTNKTLASLSRKFERFDDRITVQTRDQDQRLRKIERKAR